MHIGLSLLLVVLFLAMNAFFVIAEFALVRVRKSQLELAVEEGKKGAKSAMHIAENVNAYLSACQLGITLASLASRRFPRSFARCSSCYTCPKRLSALWRWPSATSS